MPTVLKKVIYTNWSRFSIPAGFHTDVKVQCSCVSINVKIYPNARDNHTKEGLFISYIFHRDDFKDEPIVEDFFKIINGLDGPLGWNTDDILQAEDAVASEIEQELRSKLDDDFVEVFVVHQIIIEVMRKRLAEWTSKHSVITTEEGDNMKSSKTICIDGQYFEYPGISNADVRVSRHTRYISVEIITYVEDDRTQGPLLQTTYNIYEEKFKDASIIADFFMIYNTFGGYTMFPEDLKIECSVKLIEIKEDILRKLRNDNISTVDIDEVVARAMYRAIWQHVYNHLDRLRRNDDADYEKESEEFLALFKTDLHHAKDKLESLYQECEDGYMMLFRKE